MELTQKIGQACKRLCRRPPGKRGFSRIDGIIFVSLLILLVIDVLVHIGQPGAPTKFAAARIEQTSAHAQAAAIPDIPLSPLNLQRADQHTITRSTRMRFASGATALGCDGNALAAPNSLQGPFGGSDIIFFLTCLGSDPTSVSGRLWSYMIGIVNGVMVLMLMLSGLRIMLGGSIFRYANVIEVLPGILLALIVANLSWGILAYCIQLNNGLVGTIYNQANTVPRTVAQFDGQDIVTKTCDNWWTTGVAAGGAAVAGAFTGGLGAVIGGVASGFLGHYLGCDVFPHKTSWDQQLANNNITPSNITGGLSITGLDFLFKSISNLLGYMTSIIALMLIGQMIMRLFLLQFYMILAPLGIAAWALPGRVGQGLTRQWIRGFFSTLFSQFLQVVGLIVIRLLAGYITSQVYAVFYNSNNNNDATLLWIILIAQFWFIVRIPALLGTPATSMIISFGQTVNQTAQTALMMTMAEVQFVTSLAMSAATTGIAIAR